MSERLMFVRQLESRVRARLPTECQKYNTRCGALPRKREPKTTSAQAARSVTLRQHRSGDIGWVVARHGELYAREYGWDSTMEGLVAEIAGRFLTHLDAA